MDQSSTASVAVGEFRAVSHLLTNPSVALVSSVLCVIGAVVGACVSLKVLGEPDDDQSSFQNKYTLLVAGEIILGFGSAIQDVCQYKLYPHWFQGSHMVRLEFSYPFSHPQPSFE